MFRNFIHFIEYWAEATRLFDTVFHAHYLFFAPLIQHASPPSVVDQVVVYSNTDGGTVKVDFDSGAGNKRKTVRVKLRILVRIMWG